MLNRRPIFVNGFSRGGTTILTNLLASHPDVCTVAETHQLFKGQTVTDSLWRILQKCVLYDAPILISLRQDFFSPRLIKPRKPLSPSLRWFVDRVIYHEKVRSRSTIFNRFKCPNVEYTHEEITTARLVAKNVDGMIYATDAFAEMYPDATFVGLVRNGLALCEGHLRRGRSAVEIGRRYRQLGDKMVHDAERLPRYRIFRFEDLMHDAHGYLRQLYQHAQLDVQRLKRVRMQLRRVMDATGNHRLTSGAEWDVVWLDVANFDTFFQQRVNQNQIQRLSAADRNAFLDEAGATMERLGYATEIESHDEPDVVPFPGLAEAPHVRSAA